MADKLLHLKHVGLKEEKSSMSTTNRDTSLQYRFLKYIQVVYYALNS